MKHFVSSTDQGGLVIQDLKTRMIFRKVNSYLNYLKQTGFSNG